MRNIPRLLIMMLLLSSNVLHAQVANFTATPISGCAPLVVQFTSTSTGTITSYSWNLGNSVTSSLQNPSTTYLTSGTYTVTLTVSGPGGSNTKTITNYITVQPQPTVAFATNDTAGCPPLTVHFTNTSVGNVPGSLTYLWDFGDGSTSPLATPTHVYGVPGIYSPTLVVTNSAGCSKTLVAPNYIDVYTPPNGSFTLAGNVFCHPPATVNFTNSSSGTSPFTAAWTFGDGGSGSGNTTSHTYSTAGTYNVDMIVTDAHGCKDTASLSNIVTVYTGATMNVPSSACIGSSVSFSNTTSGALTSQWTFGDGGSASSSPATHTYTTAGTYTVTLISGLGSCSDTISQTIVINPLPTATATANPRVPCDTPALVQFTGTGTGISNWAWDFGDGGTGSGSSPSHTYTSYGPMNVFYGVYTITVTITSTAGCVNTFTLRDSVMDHELYLVSTAGEPGGCAPYTVQFSPTLKSIRAPVPYNYPYPPTFYTWNFGDGSPLSSTVSPAHTYINPGTYTAVLTVTTGNGCTFTDSIHVHVGTPPTASFYGFPTTSCVKMPITFVSTTTNTITNPGTYYNWDFGDNTSQLFSTGTVTHSYLYPGTYTVTLHAFNNGCEDTAMITNYITINPPNAFFLDSLICPVAAKKIGITNISIGTTSQLWKFGDGNTDTSFAPPPHIYPNYGNYNLQLTTYNSTTGCRDTMTLPVNIQPPVMSFAAADTTVCLGDTVHLFNTSSISYSYYKWWFGPSVYSGPPDTFTHFDVPNQPRGYYTVKLIVMDYYGCYDTLTKPNYILISRPFPGFSSTLPVAGCTPLAVTFTDTSHYTVGTTGTGSIWTFGDGTGTTTTSATTSHSYLSAGAYDVKLIVTDINGCADSVTKTGLIDAHHPLASFNVSSTVPCMGDVVSFTNTSVGSGSLSYAWNFGDGGNSGVTSPTHSYSALGSYTVRLIATDALGCKDTALMTNLLSVTKPHAAFTLSDTIAVCPPLVVHFTNTSTGATSYVWDLGNSGTSILTNPVNTYSNPGYYTIRLIAYNVNGCADTAYSHVRVLGYSGALTYTPLSGCSPLVVNFTSSVANVPNTIWDFSDGSTAATTGNTYQHTYLSPGAYVPKLIFSDGLGCVNSSVGLDTIKVDGVDAGFKEFPPCVNTPVIFTDTSHTWYTPLSSWSWTFGSSTATATGTPASYTFSSAGNYNVTLIVTNGGGCKDTVVKPVTIYALPNIVGIGDTTVCPNNPAPLSGTGGVSYVWSPASSLSCSACPNPIATTPTPVTYTVIGTDVHGCKNNDTVRVGIQFKTTSAATGSGEICEGQSIQLHGSGADTYHWYPVVSLDNANIADPLASPMVTTNYMLVATEGTCPPDTNYVRVIVHPKPDLHVTGDESLVSGNTGALLASGSNIGTYLWMDDPSLSCTTCSNPMITPKRTTTYAVTALNQWGCKDTAAITVHVVCNNSQVFIPNTFTPNGDGSNDYFYPRGAGIDHITSFRVYSRWGEVLFEKKGGQLNDETTGWDGTYKGAVLPPDVYVYVVDAICDNGEPVSWKGDITLMR